MQYDDFLLKGVCIPNHLTISKEIIDFHYGKHHKAYVDNTNKLIKGTIYENLPLDEIVKQSSGPIFNNSAQAWNHEFFWNSLTPNETFPSDKLNDAIKDKWGSIDKLQEDFIAVASKVFGRVGLGWYGIHSMKV